jgi:hypothetical protein
MVEEVYKRNKTKKKLPCLKCGKPMLTTVTRRICRRCTDFRTNEYEME